MIRGLGSALLGVNRSMQVHKFWMIFEVYIGVSVFGRPCLFVYWAYG